VPSPHCGATTPIGDKCPNTIFQRKSNDETDYESDFEAERHNEATLAMRLEFQPSRARK